MRLWTTRARFIAPIATMIISIMKCVARRKFPPVKMYANVLTIEPPPAGKTFVGNVTSRFMAMPVKNCIINKTRSTESEADKVPRSILATKKSPIRVSTENYLRHSVPLFFAIGVLHGCQA